MLPSTVYVPFCRDSVQNIFILLASQRDTNVYEEGKAGAHVREMCCRVPHLKAYEPC